MARNLDPDTVASFGQEWERFDQSEISQSEASAAFDEYFSLFPWDILRKDAEGFDMGCGSGRWARFVAPRVGKLHCIEPSAAIEVARRNLQPFENIWFHKASLDDDVLKPETQDFGYSLGVLHHVPDTQSAIETCAALLKPGAPLLLYLYYAFDGRPLWFRLVWRISDWLRKIIVRLPPRMKHLASDLLAVLIYWPLARLSALLERFGVRAVNMPLFYYRNRSFYTLRTDSRDRFGTPLERRFTRGHIEHMMRNTGLINITFAEHAPYWCVLGYKS